MNGQRQRMQTLIEELNAASEAYYNGQGERMTDYEWDAKFDELKRLEEETGEVLPDSPTHKVSEDNITGQKEAHEFPALSLAKTKLPADLVKWAEGMPIWISWKLDGLTLVITYDNGKLTKVVTRGNGHIGTNITHLATAIGGIPMTIPSKGHTVIRGEAVISYDDFNRFLIESGEDYANPRNLASGSLTLKDIEEVKRRHLQWRPFTLVSQTSDLKPLSSNLNHWGSRMDWLKQQGFNPVEHKLVESPTLENVETTIQYFTEQITGKKDEKRETNNSQFSKYPFPVDGLVVTYDDTEYAATGSITGHHATKAGLAFKWKDEAAQTELVEIEWSCAASTISPVAIFKPVELEGTTVKRASLCNISECERLGMGGKGTKISVIKANKIIPKVINVAYKQGAFTIPEQCPVCHHSTEIVISENSGTKTLHCTNDDCPAKQLKKYARFVSKEGMNMDGISEQTLAKFINLGWINEYADLYHLREHIHEIAALEGFGEKSATNMMKSIEKSREVDAVHLLYALTIPLCGIDVCKRLLSAYPLEELIENAVTAENTDYFAHIHGIGTEKSASFIQWFQNEKNYHSVSQLLEKLNVSQPQLTPTGKNCEGLTFVITGDVHHYKNRNELKAYIESQGGKVASAVSGSTHYLINNDVTSSSGKNKKAKELNIPIISEDKFIEQFGTTAPTTPQEGTLF